MKRISLIDKYSPQTIDDLLLEDGIKNTLKEYIKQGRFPNTTFYGPPGIAKTTTARLIPKLLGADLLFISASLDNNIETIRSKVQEFCNSMSIQDNHKVVILDEAERLSIAGQDALRNLIDSSSSDTTFLLTTNYLERIEDPIESRCSPMMLGFSKKQLGIRIKQILDLEKVEYNTESFKGFFIDCLDKSYPDIRVVLNTLDKCIVTGILDCSQISSVVTQELEEFVDKLYSGIKENRNFTELRKSWIQNSAVFFDDYENLGKLLFERFAKEEYSKDTGKILTELTEALFRMSQVVDKEIQFSGCILRIT